METLKLSGITSTNGGKFGNIKIDGIATINGDVYCEDIHIEGIAKLGGSLNCKQAKIEGVATLKGPVDCHVLKIDGKCSSQAILQADKCEIDGMLTHRGDVEAEEFVCNGMFKIIGILNADTIKISFVYGAQATEICGHIIEIYKNTSSGFFNLIEVLPWKRNIFSGRSIEGDKVNLEHSEVDVVRGKEVSVGPGCTIGLVEYHDSINIHPSSTVNETKKIS